MEMVRSACLRGFRAVVAELGGSADHFARGAGLPESALDGDDVLIDVAAVVHVLEIAARRLACPDLGLRIASRQDLTMLGSLAMALQHSPTLDDALDCTTRYLFVHSRVVSLTFIPSAAGAGGTGRLLYGPADATGPVQATDMGVGFVHRAISYLNGGSYGLRRVELPYLPAAPLEVHQEFFGAPVVVDPRVQAAVLCVPQELGARSLPGVNRRMRQLALAFLAEQAPSVRTALAPRVRAIVQESLGTTAIATEAISALLAMHPRALQRRLATEGTTLGEIVDQVRRETAERLLTTTDLPLAQIGRMLGFAEQSALSRAARRWWNTAPRVVRQRGLDAAAPTRG